MIALCCCSLIVALPVEPLGAKHADKSRQGLSGQLSKPAGSGTRPTVDTVPEGGYYSGAVKGQDVSLEFSSSGSTWSGNLHNGGDVFAVSGTTKRDALSGRWEHATYGQGAFRIWHLSSSRIRVEMGASETRGGGQPVTFNLEKTNEPSVGRHPQLIGTWNQPPDAFDAQLSVYAGMLDMPFEEPPAALVIAFGPDGRFQTSGESGLWRTEGTNLFLKSDGAPGWEQVGRFYREGDKILFYEMDGSRNIWYKVD